MDPDLILRRIQILADRGLDCSIDDNLEGCTDYFAQILKQTDLYFFSKVVDKDLINLDNSIDSTKENLK